jgi:CubicO group peptidase (beta-lactamase class C family)
MGIDPLIQSDKPLAEFSMHVEELRSQGFRLLSLSMYGDPLAPLFSAVWDKRPGREWKWHPPQPIPDFQKTAEKEQKAGFRPLLVTATGGGSNARISGVFEGPPVFGGRPLQTELTLDQDFAQLRAEITSRGNSGWILRCATIYDGPSVSPRVAAVWGRNSGNVAWNVFAGGTEADHQKIFDAETAGWGRLAFVTGSAQGQLLAFYRDDHLGPIGGGYAARAGLTLEKFQTLRKDLLGKGFHTLCLQGYGLGSARRYAAIFVARETPVARQERATGGPEVPAIDEAVFKLMKLSNIRGAALAIVKGSRLVLARGYSWAEPDYPAVEPTTCFRLGSVSKLSGALALHQLAAEGLVSLNAKLPDALPFTGPDGKKQFLENDAYANGTVRGLVEYGNRLAPRYAGRGEEILKAFAGSQYPVTPEQIARFMLSQPPMAAPEPNKLNDFGYFLAGELIQRARGASSFPEAIAAGITKPLQITRLRTGRSLLADQPAGEARYHSRDLELHPSVMSPDQPLVHREYGDESVETLSIAGGLSAAATDIARLLAAMDLKPYTPLGRPVVDTLLQLAADGNGGHGFDRMTLADPVKKLYDGPKGGLLQTTQAGIRFISGDFSYVILWNGLHLQDTLSGPLLDQAWYPIFTEVLDAARAHAWPGTDLFPSFGMASFPEVQNQWRWCKKCQSLFRASEGSGVCPAGNGHDPSGSGDYQLMRSSNRISVLSPPLPYPYGQPGWRHCGKCEVLYFPGGKTACAAGGGHQEVILDDYRLLKDSPYPEHQGDWRRCSKCRSLFFAGGNPGSCPAGGSHDKADSGNYRLAFA